MLEQVRGDLSEYTDEPKTEFQSTLGAYVGLSSLDVGEIVTESEEEFGIEILDRDIWKFGCVKDIVNYLEAHT